eukprot:2108625-Rhodomonas_salina.2
MGPSCPVSCTSCYLSLITPNPLLRLQHTLKPAPSTLELQPSTPRRQIAALAWSSSENTSRTHWYKRKKLR